MKFKKPTEPICQSCAFSLNNSDDKGTKVDGTLSDEYCCDCYKGGEFTEPEITLKDMIEQTVTSTSKSRSMTLEEAKNYLEFLLPTLKRWR
ncbi:MAG: zinc ribbon domain-containing protein [Candidatus Hodarchaeales archaeon]